MKTQVISLLYLLIAGLLSPMPAPNPEARNPTELSPRSGTDSRENAQIWTYPADRPYGKIGQSEQHPVDYPADNFFRFKLDDQPQAGDEAYLSYQLKGVAGPEAIARSINHGLSQGGYLVHYQDQWSQQEEPIDAQGLVAGINTVQFTVPEALKALVEIQEVQLIVKRPYRSDSRSVKKIVLSNIPRYYSNGKAYLQGFVRGADTDEVMLTVAGHQVAVQDRHFEVLLEKPAGYPDQWPIAMRAVFPDGTQTRKELTLKEGRKADVVVPPAAKGITSRLMPAAEQTTRLTLAGAVLRLPPHSLEQVTELSITTLRSIDLPPTGPELINVTGRAAGFRMLPHGTTFRRAADLQLPIDPEKIPRGYTAHDVRTFFFDEQSGKWTALPKDTLIAADHQLISQTTHFTDFINGIIRLPESPQTQGYTPTAIKDLEAVSPAQGIVTIEPPTAGNMGTAAMSFPLKLPTGRKGLQPELAITYSNEAGNGWLGLSWMLDLPSIEVETRWGVPRYLADLESETYTFNGEQLYPLSHRSALKPRNGNKKTFYPRVDAAFQRIIRHGNGPRNYWWEVTDKNGTRHFYGGRPGQGLDSDAVLTDDKGNIAEWMLVETRDLDENFIRYEYEIAEDPGVIGGSLMGRQIYPSRISYTGHEQTEGKYSVAFFRDRPGAARRRDVEIDARQGFKKVTADLLYRIEVTFDGALVRSYELDYEEGAFYKTLLAGIAELDRNGEVFYRHDFEYFDEVRQDGNYQPFREAQSWDSPLDKIQANLVTPINKESTVLGGSRSNSFSVGAAVTVGSVLGNPFAKTYTAGGNYNYSNADSYGMSSLVDISGDGLPDKLFAEGNRLFFRKNNGLDGFGEKQAVTGFNDIFEHTITKSNSVGLEAHPYPGFLGFTQTWSTSTTDRYFIDLNGDGLIDIANNGKGYFNFLNTSGVPEFSTQSALTPSPIFEGALGDVAPPPLTQEEIDSLIDQFPLHDIVRMWEAPFDGVVTIDAPAALIGNDLPEVQTYGKNDGVSLAIQVGGIEYWRDQLLPGGPLQITPNPNAVSNITVNRGDRIYFRVQSIGDGRYDQVNWDPRITYLNQNAAALDANGKTTYVFQANEDFITASCQVINLPVAGTVSVSGTFRKPVTSDDVRVQIVRLEDGVETLLLDQAFAWDETVDLPIELTDFAVAEEEEWLFRVVSNTNIDWSAISWLPLISYTATADNSPTEGLSICPAVDFSMYNAVQRLTPVWQPTDTANYQIDPVFSLDPNNLGAINKSFDVTLSVKGIHQLYAKRVFTLVNGGLQNVGPINVELPANDSLFIEYHIGDDLLPDNAAELVLAGLANSQVTITNTDMPTPIPLVQAAGVYSRIPEADIIFGPLYRGWGHFAYNGNRERAGQPINEAELNADEYEPEGEFDEDTPPEEIEVDFNPAEINFVILIAEPKRDRWVGLDTLTYIQGGRLSSSRFGEDDVSGVTLIQAGADCKYAPNKVSKSSTQSGTGGIGPLSAGGTWCTTESVTDFMDLNGDRYPDIVFEKKIVFTDQRGGLTQTVNYALGNHQAKSFAVGGGAAGNPGNSNTSNSGNASGAGSNRSSIKAKARSGRLSYNSKEATETASFVGTLSANVNYDQDRAVHSWMDMNGDGLPDKVFESGAVALNLGYSFGPKENWGQEKVRAGESIDIGVGLGVNLFNGSFEAGISSSLSFNSSTGALQDVNGDGLVDYIITEGYVQGKFNDVVQRVGQAFTKGEPVADGLIEGLVQPKDNILVRLNTGNGLSTEAIEWPGVSVMDHGSSAAESVNTAVTGCIPIVFIGIRICFNPNGSVGRGVSRQKTQLTDINGDGYPDHLESDNDGDLEVKLSAIGKTNFLKGIRQPFGGTVEIDYTFVGNTPDMPFGKWVLSTTTVSDGLSGDGADRMTTTYEYSDGYFDRHERMFYGFDTVRVHQLDTENNDERYRTSVNTYFNRDYYRKGLPKSEWTEDAAGNRYTETRYSYTLTDRLTNNELAAGLERSDSSTVFPAMTQMRQLFYEGLPQPTLETRMEYQYDEWGNVVEYVDMGDGRPEDKVTARIRYHDQPQTYLKSSPASIEVETIAGIIRQREADIDDNGNLVRIRQFLTDGQVAVYDLTYNEYGLLEHIDRPANYRGERLFYEYTYDEVVQSYVTEVRDAYGYSSSTVYDYAFGQILETVDLNGQLTAYTIDDRGRTSALTGPYELEAGAPYTIAYEYFTDTDRPYAVTRHYDPEHGRDIEVYTFVDGLMRPVQTKKTGSIFLGNDQADQLQLIVSGKVIYDAFGRQRAAHYPTTEAFANAAVYNPAVDNVAPTQMTYDVMDRILSTTFPDGSRLEMTYDFGKDNTDYTAFRTTTTDPLGNVREKFSDVRGRERAIAAHGPDGPIWTGFRYNALSELIRVIDHLFNETIYTYDHFGRQLSRQHPDGGLETYQYDLANNMIAKVTANIRAELPEGAIRYTYDHERMTGVDYPINYQNKVQLHYGEPGARHNRAGRVWLIEDASGGTEYFFGPLGEQIKIIRTLLTSEGNVRTFVSERTYDTWNRIQQMIYPDGEVVDYAYNEAGKLQRMSSEKAGVTYAIVDQLGYDQFEQRVFCAYGNGTQTRYQYEPDRRRLDQLQVALPGGSSLVDKRYRFDPIGNILEMTNGAAPGNGQPGGASTHAYQYDKLYRLTGASGSWNGQGAAASYQLSMQYDDLHNIRRKTQVHDPGLGRSKDTNYDLEYWYDSAQPHTASEIGDRRLTYDANGNLQSWQDTVDNTFWQLVWDEENRLQAVSNNGYKSQYTYDAGGERAVKSHGSNRGVFVNGAPVGATAINHASNYTAYVSPYLVARENSFTKHYYVEEERVLSRIGTGEFHNDYWYYRGITAGNKNYVKRIQLLQQAYWQQVRNLNRPPGEPTLPIGGFEVISPDSLPAYDNSIPEGWPRPIEVDTTRPPGEPTMVQYQTLTNDDVRAGYGFTGAGAPREINQFFYHPDHLGSSGYITDVVGNVRQHTEYLPFGETFVDEHLHPEVQPYLFNAKELDEATGLYYYGARYYDPKTSVWLGVDPEAASYPEMSPFAYVANNPITYLDPDGERIAIKYGSKTFIYHPKAPVPNNRFVRDVVKSLKHIQQSKVGKSVVRNLARHKSTVNIMFARDGEAMFLHDNHQVRWHPGLGLKFSERSEGNHYAGKSKISPALILLHELGHAEGYLQDRRGVRGLMNRRDRHYDDKEEKRVIKFVENPAANEFGEATRRHHGGEFFKAIDPRSNIEKPNRDILKRGGRSKKRTNNRPLRNN